MKKTRRFSSIERLEDRIAPASLLVTHLADDATPGSLRTAVGAASGTPGPDTISFKAGVTGTITLALGPLYFLDGVTIKGPGSSKLTIDGGGGQVLIFDNAATDDPVSVSGLTLQNGAGAGDGRLIQSAEPTTVSDVKFVGNNGPLTDKGGALWMETAGNITIKNSQFVGSNRALLGGGAHLTATGAAAKVVISGTIFEGNYAEQQGGALWIAVPGAQAGVTLDRASFISNGTDVGSGGAVYITSGGGITMVKNCLLTINATLFASGGAISQGGGHLIVQNSLLDGNRSQDGGAISFSGVSFVAKNSQFTLNRSASANQGFGEGGGALHLIGVPKWRVGGSTFIGNQAAADGGAIIATSDDGEVFGSTFRANSSAEDGGAIHFRQSKATVKSSLFSANTADYGGAVSTDQTPLFVVGSRFTGNLATVEGGALYTRSDTVTVSGSAFDRNTSLGAGGAVALHSYFTSLGNVYRGNHAGGSGGAIAMPLDAGVLTVKGGSVSDNRAAGAGGGIFIQDADGVLLEKVLIRDNQATGNGGGVSLRVTFPTISVVLTGNTILDNTTSTAGFGGGLFLDSIPAVLLTKNKITGNFAGNGGGVFNAGSAAATDNQIFNNLALSHADSFGL